MVHRGLWKSSGNFFLTDDHPSPQNLSGATGFPTGFSHVSLLHGFSSSWGLDSSTGVKKGPRVTKGTVFIGRSKEFVSKRRKEIHRCGVTHTYSTKIVVLVSWIPLLRLVGVIVVDDRTCLEWFSKVDTTHKVDVQYLISLVIWVLFRVASSCGVPDLSLSSLVTAFFSKWVCTRKWYRFLVSGLLREPLDLFYMGLPDPSTKCTVNPLPLVKSYLSLQMK